MLIINQCGFKMISNLQKILSYFNNNKNDNMQCPSIHFLKTAFTLKSMEELLGKD